MPYSLLIDVVVALLLVVTIGYAIRLNKRLGMLRRDKSKLEKLATTFADSTIRADESLGHLRLTADMMQKQIESAQTLHDDLAFLLDRGEKTADRLEDMVRESRDYGGRSSKPVSEEKDSDLAAATEATDSGSRPLTSNGTDEIDEGAPRPAPRVVSDEQDDISARTEAERELLKALRSAN